MIKSDAIQLKAIVAYVMIPLRLAFPIGMLALTGFLE